MSSQGLAVKRLYIILMTILISFAAAVLIGGLPAKAESEEQKAEDIIRKCGISSSSGNTDYAKLWNDKLDTVFIVTGEGEQYIAVDLTETAAQGLYIRWARNPSPWRLECTGSDGQIVSSEWGNDGYLQEYVELPAGTASFRIVTDDGKNHPLRMVELEIYSPGSLPDSVHKWQPTPSTAEFMMISTHQDDELLFFGGAIPYYTGELGYDTVIAYIAYDDDLRLHEALEGLWTCGARQHPLFFGHPDKYCSTMDRARTIWSEQKVTRDITELLVRYRPQVVISQDINGEYGHGQHILMVRCIRNALKNAESADYIASNLAEYQPWSVSKCYLHLYWENRIVMRWNEIKLDSAGGKSSLQVAKDAYQCHVSQHKFGYEVGSTDKNFDCRQFGLYRTTVGLDTAKSDFLENITPRYTNAEPTDNIPSWLQRTSLKGWHYRVTDSRWQGSEYLRCCKVNDIIGWYEADRTGSLIEPIKRVELVIDDQSLDLSAYGTLTQISESPRVFSYSNNIIVQGMPVRYCAVGDGEPGFYVTDRSGYLAYPLQRIHVSAVEMQELRLPKLTLKNKGAIDTAQAAIIVVCCLLIITALALSVSVVRLIAINRRRARQQRSRRYPDHRGHRYR